MYTIEHVFILRKEQKCDFEGIFGI